MTLQHEGCPKCGRQENYLWKNLTTGMIRCSRCIMDSDYE